MYFIFEKKYDTTNHLNDTSYDSAVKTLIHSTAHKKNPLDKDFLSQQLKILEISPIIKAPSFPKKTLCYAVNNNTLHGNLKFRQSRK